MTEDVPWWRRRWRRGGLLTAVAVLVVAALIGGALLVIRQHSDKGRLPVGASRPGDYSVGGGYFSGIYEFEVPGAKIRVNLEAGRRASKLDASYNVTRVKAPRDGMLVHLDWSSTVSGGAETQYVGAHEVSSDKPYAIYTGGHPTKLSVRGKGSSVVVDPSLVPAGGATSSSGSDDDSDESVVAVRGDLSDLRLALTFQGRTQSVSLVNGRRDMGDFASLYAVGNYAVRPVTVEHEQPAQTGPTFRSSCDLLTGRVTRAPYLDGLGWAAPGQQWLLLTGAGYQAWADAARWSDGRHVGFYAIEKTPHPTVTVNGEKPVKPLGKPVVTSKDELTTGTRNYVFSVAAGAAVTVDVAATLPLKRAAHSDAKAPAHKTLELHTTDSYPAVIDPAVRAR